MAFLLAFPFTRLGPPAWGPALASGIGCALPLSLGLFSGHPGFYWATIGAFVASQSHPLARLGMHAMLGLLLLGAASVALGFAVAQSPLLGLLLFAFYGGLLALARQRGVEQGKFTLVLLLCLCFGQGQYGLGSFDNPAAIAMLFLLGGLLVALLGFGLRGAHGMRMWPALPPLASLRRLQRRQRRGNLHTHATGWFLAYALLASGLAGFAADFFLLPQSQWLTLSVALLLGGWWPGSLWRVLFLHGVLLVGLASLDFLGYSLTGTPLMVMVTLPLVMLVRLYQARRYGVYAFQASLGLLLLSESLALDWSEPQWRLINAALGTGISLASLLLLGLLRHLCLTRSGTRSNACHPADRPVPLHD